MSNPRIDNRVKIIIRKAGDISTLAHELKRTDLSKQERMELLDAIALDGLEICHSVVFIKNHTKGESNE